MCVLVCVHETCASSGNLSRKHAAALMLAFNVAMRGAIFAEKFTHILFTKIIISSMNTKTCVYINAQTSHIPTVFPSHPHPSIIVPTTLTATGARRKRVCVRLSVCTSGRCFALVEENS